MAFVSSVSLSSKPFAGNHVVPATSTVRPRVPSAGPRMAAASDADVPDMGKRRTMNVLLFSAASSVAVSCLYPLASFFVPKSAGSGGGGIVAKDALGNDVKKIDYIKSHLAGSRELVQGLRGDATYLIVTDDKSDLEYYALNAVCTHLGCVVPWNPAEKKFKCPCHGSQYDPTGAVVRGPAPLPLALEHVDEDSSGNVVLKSWKEDDFRTGQKPWWNF